MEITFKETTLFNELLNLKKRVIVDGKIFPEFIFVEKSLFLLAFGTGEIVGDMQGIFHGRLCNILKNSAENKYHVFPLSHNMYHCYEKLPIFTFFNFDKVKTYTAAFNLDFTDQEKESYLDFISLPDNLLFISQDLKWFILDNDHLGWSIFGCYDKNILKIAEKELESFILDKRAIASEIGIAYTLDEQALFKQNYWDLLIQ